MGAKVLDALIVSDDLEPLAEKLRACADRADVNLVITTGGTGFSPRDNTPEATRAAIEREAPGLSEAMRMATLKQTPLAMISAGLPLRYGALTSLCRLAQGSANFAVIKHVLPHASRLAGSRTGNRRRRRWLKSGGSQTASRLRYLRQRAIGATAAAVTNCLKTPNGRLVSPAG